MNKYPSPSSWKLASLRLLAISLFLAFSSPAVLAQVFPDSLIVLDPLAGKSSQGVIFVVGPDGSRIVLSQLLDDAQGQPVSGNNGLAVGASGRLYFPSGRLVVSINPLTGTRKAIITEDACTKDGEGADALLGVAVDNQGRVYASDGPLRALFRIDPDTGECVVLSRFDEASEGAQILRGDRMLLESETTLLVLDRSAHSIVRVDLETGNREPVASFLDPSKGPGALTLSGFALEPSGNLLVTSFSSRLLFRVLVDRNDPDRNGMRSVVTDFDDGNLGPTGRVLEGVAVDSSGRIFVLDSQANLSNFREGAIFEVDPDTGRRTLLTDFSLDAQGPKGFKPSSIAVAVPVTPTEEDLKLVRSVVVATDKLKVQKEAVVNTGSLYVNGPSGQAVINKGATTPALYEVGANALKIKKQAVVGGDVVVNNFFKNQGTVEGMESIREFPIFGGLLPLQSAVPGDANVEVSKDGFLSLTPGRYNNISIKKDAVLSLTGGVYEAENLKASKRAEVIFEAPVVIRLSKGAKFGKDSFFGPSEGLTLDAKDAVVHVQGGLKAGTGSSIDANIVAPDSSCKFGKFSQFTGFAYCRDVSLGKGAEASLRNFLEDSIVDSEDSE